LNPPPTGKRLRIGGLVKEGSIVKEGVQVRFEVTDGAKSIPVRYQAMLPDLFREKQGVVVQGAFQPDRTFVATTVLAKHDENYVPKELADELKKQGLWQHDKAKPAK
jgi:cytochrome c-type biogenesis protein CcmE